MNLSEGHFAREFIKNNLLKSDENKLSMYKYQKHPFLHLSWKLEHCVKNSKPFCLQMDKKQ